MSALDRVARKMPGWLHPPKPGHECPDCGRKRSVCKECQRDIMRAQARTACATDKPGDLFP